MAENENELQSPTDYNMTFFEACEFLSKSKKSLGRYIRRGLISFQKIKSQQGTLEYRFSKMDLENFKKLALSEETRQDTPDRTGQTEQTGHQEMVEFLKDQIKVKDEQIGQLMERDREVNVILKNLHDKIFRLEAPEKKDNQSGD